MGGIVLLGFGFTSLFTALEGLDRKDSESNPRALTFNLAAVGLISVGTASVLLISGSLARRDFDRWRADTGAVVRKNGTGLITGGALLMAVGSASLVYAGLVARVEPDVIVPVLITLGAAEVAAGIGLLSGGLVRRSRHRAWQSSTSMPTLVPLPRGAGLGLVGRF